MQKLGERWAGKARFADATWGVNFTWSTIPLLRVTEGEERAQGRLAAAFSDSVAPPLISASSTAGGYEMNHLTPSDCGSSPPVPI